MIQNDGWGRVVLAQLHNAGGRRPKLQLVSSLRECGVR
jgi:hypothetical protein